MIFSITDIPTEIVKPHIESKSDVNYKKYRGFHTGVDVKAASVYNLCPGTAVLVSRVGNEQIVIVQYDLNNCIQYKGLYDCFVTAGDFVDTHQLIGHVRRFVHVDYLTSGENIWPVRVGAQTLYKHDPTDIVLYGYESVVNYASMITADDPTYVDTDELPPTVDKMLYYNRERSDTV